MKIKVYISEKEELRTSKFIDVLIKKNCVMNKTHTSFLATKAKAINFL